MDDLALNQLWLSLEQDVRPGSTDRRMNHKRRRIGHAIRQSINDPCLNVWPELYPCLDQREENTEVTHVPGFRRILNALASKIVTCANLLATTGVYLDCASFRVCMRKVEPQQSINYSV
jgi:hypothetical protein